MSQDNEKIIKEYLQKMVTQDNRGTAAPFFYVIRDCEEVFEEDCCGEDYYFNEGSHWNYEEYCRLCCGDDTPPTEHEFSQMDGVMCGFFADRYVIIDSTLFLTETDAQSHLEANKHHYSEKAHTYVMHAWRAPELREFLSALLRHFDIKPENSYKEIIR